MPNAKTHMIVGAGAGFLSLAIIPSSQPMTSLAVLLGRIAGGLAGGCLPEGLKELRENVGKTMDSQNAQPWIVRDSDLSLIVENWNSLPPPIRLAVMALVRTSLEREGK